MTTLGEVRDNWDRAAQVDAMGHILTSGQAWTVDDFMANGREEIDLVLGRLDGLGILGKRRDKALDFGCGVGRLTQALAEHYATVVGVDIAPSMVEQAKAINTRPKVSFKVAESLTRWKSDSWDLIYTMIVLQHMPQEVSHPYIGEFIRLLRGDGVAVIEIPDGPDIGHDKNCLSMWGTPRETMRELVENAGGEMLDEELIDEPSQWSCYRYTARRR